MKLLHAAAALILTVSAAEAASTARATGDLPIRWGPGGGYAQIGVLPDGAEVPLRRCTRKSEWCLIANPYGPDGWVRGSYLVGSPAKVEATPPDFPRGFGFMDDPFWD